MVTFFVHTKKVTPPHYHTVAVKSNPRRESVKGGMQMSKYDFLTFMVLILALIIALKA